MLLIVLNSKPILIAKFSKLSILSKALKTMQIKGEILVPNSTYY